MSALLCGGDDGGGEEAASQPVLPPNRNVAYASTGNEKENPPIIRNSSPLFPSSKSPLARRMSHIKAAHDNCVLPYVVQRDAVVAGERRGKSVFLLTMPPYRGGGRTESGRIGSRSFPLTVETGSRYTCALAGKCQN